MEPVDRGPRPDDGGRTRAPEDRAGNAQRSRRIRAVQSEVRSGEERQRGAGKGSRRIAARSAGPARCGHQRDEHQRCNQAHHGRQRGRAIIGEATPEHRARCSPATAHRGRSQDSPDRNPRHARARPAVGRENDDRRPQVLGKPAISTRMKICQSSKKKSLP